MYRPVIPRRRPYTYRLYRRWWPYAGWPGLYPNYGVESPYTFPEEPSRLPDLPGVSRPASQALWRCGLLEGIWSERLMNASAGLAAFIDRFYRTAGFDQVVRACYGYPHQRLAAREAYRLADRIASLEGGFERQLGFETDLAFTDGGQLLPLVGLVYGRQRYRFLPWSRLYASSLRKQFARDLELSEDVEMIHWVFNGRRLKMRRQEAIREIRRILSPDSQRYTPAMRGWLDRLERLVIVSE